MIIYYILCFIIGMYIWTQVNNLIHTGKFITDLKKMVSLIFQKNNYFYNTYCFNKGFKQYHY